MTWIDSQKDASQTKECNKGQTENSEKDSQKDGSQPNEANKGQKSAESGGAIKDAQDNKIQAEERNKNQTGKLNSAQTSAKTAAPGTVYMYNVHSVKCNFFMNSM